MVRRATSQDVADRAGVSRSAVSLVLNGRAEGIVAAHKQALIIEAARELRYRPDTVALSLRTRRTTMLALVADLADPLVTPILAGAVATADRHDYAIMVLDAGGSDPWETMDNRRVDGVIMVGPTASAPDLPVVVIDIVASTADLPSFVPDLTGGARAGLEHLLELGHRQIGVIGDENSPVGQLWRRGIDEAVGRDARVRSWHADDSIAGGRTATEGLLAAHPDVTALAGQSDQMALGAYLAAAELGRPVPATLSILGFDENPSLVAGPAPPLSTIRLPRRELGARAADEVIRVLAGGGAVPAGTTTLSAELVVRASTAPA